ncbi:MAG: SdiA-regulated domain-containing protein [Bacteroidota bacterium]
MLLLKKYLFILYLGMILLFSCNDDDGGEDVQKDTLELLATYEINVLEPSGLAINESGTALYTVSDNTAKVYKLSTTGNVIKTYGYVGNDLEGVSTFTGTKLLLAEERTKQIVTYDMGTGHTLKHRIDFENNDDNSGIEGVAYAKNLDAIFILNEKNPGKLIRLRSDFSIIAEYDLNFASDYSGIFYESSTNNLWIVSDQNKTLNKCTPKGDLIESYSIRVTQAEGIAISGDKIYVISDAEEKLYIYKKPKN